MTPHARILSPLAGALTLGLASGAMAQTPPRDYTADLNAMPSAAAAPAEPPAAQPAPAPQPAQQTQAEVPPLPAQEPRPAIPQPTTPAAPPAPPPQTTVSAASAPRALTRAEIAELPFTIGLQEGMTLTAGRAAPGSQTWTARRDGRALLMIYAGPSSLFPIHDGQTIEAGGRTSIVVVENGRRRAVEHLYVRTVAPHQLHVWVAAAEGADRDQAEALAHSVAPR